MPKRLAVVGPRGAGKSCFTLSLEAGLKAAGHAAAAHELDIYSHTHPWMRGEITAEEREQRKIFVVDWDKARATRAAFEADPSHIVLGDMAGGRFADPPYADRDFMLEAVDAAILVGRYPSGKDGDSTTENWGWLMSQLGIPVIAKVHSMLRGQRRFAGFIAAYDLDRRLGIQPHNAAIQIVIGYIEEWIQQQLNQAELEAVGLTKAI